MKIAFIFPAKIDPNEAIVEFTLAEHKRITRETLKGIESVPMTPELKKEIDQLLLDDKTYERNLNNMLADYKQAKKSNLPYG